MSNVTAMLRGAASRLVSIVAMVASLFISFVSPAYAHTTGPFGHYTPYGPMSTAGLSESATAAAESDANASENYCVNPVGRLVTDTLTSTVLGMDLPVQIYLPPCYDPVHNEYPTLYLIQGSNYVVGQWVDDGITRIAEIQMSLSIIAPFIIVMPANDLDSYNSLYLNSSDGKGSWEDFIVSELVPYVDNTYSTWKDRAGRAIGGISRGGYWSLEIALVHPDLFSTVGGHSPAVAPGYLVGVNDDFSILSYADSVDVLHQLRIYLDAGNNDEMLPGVQQLASELTADKVLFTHSTAIGIHDDNYWTSRMTDYLDFYASVWPVAARTRSQDAGSLRNLQIR